MKNILFAILLGISITIIALHNTFAATYPGFSKLDEGKCVVLDGVDVNKLPPEWHKYKGFVKKCEMRRTKTSEAKFSVISIWAHEYLDARHKTSWEDFPSSIIADNNFSQLGQLPEIYPMDSPTHLIIYYGIWKNNIPTEIMIDVSNPAVTGDYYYEPLVWDAQLAKYVLKNSEAKDGKRQIRTKQIKRK